MTADYSFSNLYNSRYSLPPRSNGSKSTCIKISPDGQYFAVSTSDSTIAIHTLASGKLKIKFHGHTKGVSDICWSPDSHYLASASDDRTIKLWGLAEAQCIRTFVGHSYSVSCVQFNYKGNLLISGSADEAIRIWDVQRGKCLKTLSTHSDPISSVDVSWDGTILASGSYDGLIRLFDVLSGQCLKTLMYEMTDSSFPISYIKFSPNGKYLLSSSLDGVIRLWNYNNNKVVKTYRNHRYKPSPSATGGGQVYGDEELSVAEKYTCSTEFITVNNKPSMIASGTEHGNILMWDLDTKKIATILSTGEDSPVLQIDTAQSGKVLASVTLSGLVQVWDLQE
ncbi:Swd3 protein [Saccharomycopsis crataegensis]|uniref:Swd3 protein n=1 Tax=Saccharomycopsis crataegensis TaxID=43959 RepID=A0AAV5QRX4_9ASCO|nr:Swd3 protein [Saccharomycopsis crataegensis]